jgi:DNA-binding transcriptional LysR family regulator
MALAVAEHRNFGLTAKALGITQPSVSVTLQRLEDILGVTLFQRENGSMIEGVTPAGEILLPLLEQMNTLYANTMAVAEDLAAGNPPQEALCQPMVPTARVVQAISDLQDIKMTGMLRTQTHAAIDAVISDLQEEI